MSAADSRPAAVLPETALPRGGWLGALRPTGLAGRFARAMVLLVALALACTGAVNMWLAYAEATAAAVSVQREKAIGAAERVAQFIGEIESQMGWTTRAEWARVSLDQRRYDFIRLLRQAPAITDLLFIDGQGREQLRLSRLEPDAVGSGTDLSADPRFARAIADRVWFSPVYFRRGSEPYMVLSIAHAGRNPGVTSASVNLKLIWDVIAAIRVGTAGYAYVTDAQGRLVAHPDMSLVLRETDLSHLPQVARAIREGHSTSGGSDAPQTVTGLDGRPVLSAHAHIPKLGWYVFVELPRQEVLAPVLATLAQTLALLVLSVLLALVIAGFLARRMVVPIRQLQAGAQRLGEGDLTQRIAIASRDEIGALAERFNTMASRIQESQETLEHKVEERTADLNDALAQQTATSKILQVIAASQNDTQPVLRAVVQSAMEVCDAYDCAVLLKEDDHLVFKAHQGPIPIGIDRWPLNRNWTVGRAVLDRQTVQVVDIRGPEGETLPDGREMSIRLGMGHRTIAAVPLLREGEAIGAIAVRRQEVHAFSDKQLALLRSFADQAVIAIENERLFNETQEALEQQRASAEILSVISSSVADTQPVFDKILQSFKHLFGSDELDVLLVGEDGQLRIAAYLGDSHDIVAATFPAPVERTPAGRAIRERRVMHWPDLVHGEDVPGVLRKMAKLIGYRSMAFAPMISEDRPVGALGVARSTGPFKPKELELLKTFADQAVIAIENTRLFHEVQERTRDLEASLGQQTATAEVLKVISRSAFDLPAVLRALLETAAKLSDAQICLLFQVEGDRLVPVTSHGGNADFVDFHNRTPLPIDRSSIAGRTVLERRTIHVPDIEADPEYGISQSFLLGGWRSIIGVPLLREGVVIGTLALARAARGPYTARQIELTESFADQAVIAIENSRLFEEVKAKTHELEQSLDDLRRTQDRLVQTEKLASLGQLTAGIAHEIKNPLNFVNNFADLSTELLDELREAVAPERAQLDAALRDEIDDLTETLKGNLDKIVQHGRRADSIVRNMLMHSRTGEAEARKVMLNDLATEALNLAYHGARAAKSDFNITLEQELDPAAGAVEVFPQEITRVLLNLCGNGFYAAHKRAAEAGAGFAPTLRLKTRNLGERVEIRVRDNGTGMPAAVRAKIFEPFFTTKPAGEGTGLGLSLSYDIIVKQHGGTISVDSQVDAFTEFVVTLPRALETSGRRAA